MVVGVVVSTAGVPSPKSQWYVSGRAFGSPLPLPSKVTVNGGAPAVDACVEHFETVPPGEVVDAANGAAVPKVTLWI